MWIVILSILHAKSFRMPIHFQYEISNSFIILSHDRLSLCSSTFDRTVFSMLYITFFFIENSVSNILSNAQSRVITRR